MPLTADDVKIKRTYWGTGIADDIEQGVQNLMIGAATKVQEMAQDQEGIVDDALRLVGGGIKNVQAAAADQEGITDDALRLMGGGVKNTLKVLGIAGEAGGWLGGKAAGALGVDPRIGGAFGSVVGDLVPLGGAVRALKISKTAQRMSRLTKQGHGLQLDHILKAGKGKQYGFAYGDAGQLAIQKPSLVDAATASGKTRGKIKNLAMQADDAVRAATPSVSPDLVAIPKGMDIREQVENATKFRQQAIKLKTKETKLSRGATIGPIDSNDVKIWDLGAKDKAMKVPREVGNTIFKGKNWEASIKGMSYQELHHEVTKAVTDNYVQQAWGLVDAGKATPADIINLNHIARKYDFGLGDYGVEPLNKLAHQMAHNVSRVTGIEPSAAEIAKMTKFKNINELTKDFTRSLDEMAVPMRRQMDLHQRAYNALKPGDRVKFIDLGNKKDVMKKQLKESFQRLVGKDMPDIPTAVKDKYQVEKWVSKRTDNPEVIKAARKVDAIRKKQDDFAEILKGRVSGQVKKDIEWDVQLMDKVIDNLHSAGEGIKIGSPLSRNKRLMIQSSEEAANKTWYGAGKDVYEP